MRRLVVICFNGQGHATRTAKRQPPIPIQFETVQEYCLEVRTLLGELAQEPFFTSGAELTTLLVQPDAVTKDTERRWLSREGTARMSLYAMACRKDDDETRPATRATVHQFAADEFLDWAEDIPKPVLVLVAALLLAPPHSCQRRGHFDVTAFAGRHTHVVHTAAGQLLQVKGVQGLGGLGRRNCSCLAKNQGCSRPRGLVGHGFRSAFLPAPVCSSRSGARSVGPGRTPAGATPAAAPKGT
jgi:hypothetical protein